jgi:hypothetical protein
VRNATFFVQASVTKPRSQRLPGNAEILEQSQQNAPGTGGTSKPGAAGLPGSKSGATKTPESLPQSGSSTPPTLQQDQSRVPGITGSKSGMAPSSNNETQLTNGYLAARAANFLGC